ncbi:protein PELPK2-like [Mercurialis annua]|uniref:protein PELPK2-like n=1 Tax=Mercurialis annua TaxID=3986 RepID=UPI00215ED10A|nr:protein PELPK2-like [Mercurialis annua]
MARYNNILILMLIALSFSWLDVSLAARNILQIPFMPSLPTLPISQPSLPDIGIPSLQSMLDGKLPAIPMFGTGLPTFSVPSLPTIPTLFPALSNKPEVHSVPSTLPPIPSLS